MLSEQPTELRVDYVGAATNGVDPVYDRMYVALEDSAGNVGVYDNPDGNAAQVTAWTQWYVSLKDIHYAGQPNAVQLAAVSCFLPRLWSALSPERISEHRRHRQRDV